MYFTTGINVVYAIRSRHDYEASVFPSLLFFFDLRKQGVIRFIHMEPKSHCLYLLLIHEPAAPVAVLE